VLLSTVVLLSIIVLLSTEVLLLTMVLLSIEVLLSMGIVSFTKAPVPGTISIGEVGLMRVAGSTFSSSLVRGLT